MSNNTEAYATCGPALSPPLIRSNVGPEPAGKMCRGCHRDRPVARFMPSRFTVDGLTDRCLDCCLDDAQRDRRARELRMVPVATGKGASRARQY